MNKKVLIVAVIVLFAVAGGVFAFVKMNNKDVQAPSSAESTASDSSAKTTETTEETADTGAASPMSATIVFTNDGFTPATLSVKKGAVITVKNESSTRVQFSSDDHPTHRENTEMNLKTLSAGESASFTADTVGTHGFHDHIDDSKTGVLTVTE